MSILILVILALVWAVFLLKPVFQTKNLKKTNSISDFNYQLSVLSKNKSHSHQPARFVSTPIQQNILMPASKSGSLKNVVKQTKSNQNKRKQQVLITLFSVVVASFLIALFAGTTFWVVNIITDLALATYVMLLLRLKNNSNEKVYKSKSIILDEELETKKPYFDNPLLDKNAIVDIDLVELERAERKSKITVARQTAMSKTKI